LRLAKAVAQQRLEVLDFECAQQLLVAADDLTDLRKVAAGLQDLVDSLRQPWRDRRPDFSHEPAGALVEAKELTARGKA
jgi:hypothetical protein